MGKYNAKFEKYKELKFLNPNKLYIFENGIFYITYNEDADKIKEIFGFIIKQMGNAYRKCEFPIQYFDRYEKALNLKNIDFEIVENIENKSKTKIKNEYDLSVVDSTSTRCNNIMHLELIQMIKKVDLCSSTPIQALNLIAEMQNKIKKSENM